MSLPGATVELIDRGCAAALTALARTNWAVDIGSAEYPIRRGDVLALLDLYGVSEARQRCSGSGC